jgi:hypothetical protein
MAETADVRAVKARALEYIRSRGTDAPAESVRQGVRDAFSSLETFLGSVPEKLIDRAPRDGEWSVREIADHLLETHRPGLDELRCLAAGQRPPGDPIPASLQSRVPALRPWIWLLRQLGEVHADILATLAAIPDDFTAPARAPVVMVVNVRDAGGMTSAVQWIEELDWKAYAIVWRLHAIDHLRQARAAVAAATPSTWGPRDGTGHSSNTATDG